MTPREEESALYNEALLALERGDLKQASGLCQELLEQEPQSACGFYLMSSLFQATGNFRKARDYAELATEMDSCVARYHVQQGHILLALRDYEKAIECFVNAIKLSPEDVDTYLHLGDAFRECGRFEEAHQAYDKAAQLAPSEKIASARAECYLAQGKVEQAKALLTAHIEEYTNHSRPSFILSLIALIEDDFQGAEQRLRLSLSLNEKYVPAHFYLALILLHYGKEKAAIEHCLQALSVEPTHIKSLLILGYIFVRQANYASALKAFTHVLAIEPNHLLCWQNVLQIMLNNNQLPEGLKQLTETINYSDTPLPLKHLRALYRGDVPPFAPKYYVAQMYNHLAIAFDYWLLASRDERALSELHSALRGLDLLQEKIYISLLDLGCNTGCSAELLRDRIGICVGVDVSSEMIKLAQRNGCYDVVYEMDITDYALSSEMQFDVIISAGALRWIGNVQPFFQAIRGVMVSHSVFAFMVAKEPSTLAYTVAFDGRYSHNATYIQDIAAAEGLEIICHKECVWLDAEEGMMTRHLFIMKKMVLH